MASKIKQVWDYAQGLLDMPSGTGIGLVVLNAIGWCWYDVLHHGLGSSEVGIVAVIFGGKTVHGIMTNGAPNDKD